MNSKTTRFEIFHITEGSEPEIIVDLEIEIKNAVHMVQDPNLMYVAHNSNVLLNKYGYHIKYVGEDNE